MVLSDIIYVFKFVTYSETITSSTFVKVNIGKSVVVSDLVVYLQVFSFFLFSCIVRGPNQQPISFLVPRMEVQS